MSNIEPTKEKTDYVAMYPAPDDSQHDWRLERMRFEDLEAKISAIQKKHKEDREVAEKRHTERRNEIRKDISDTEEAIHKQ